MGILSYPKFKAFIPGTDEPLVGGKLYTYIVGTSYPKAAYQDSACIVPHTNPIILDSNGEAEIHLNGSYKFILKTSADVTIWTIGEVFSYDIQTSGAIPIDTGSGNNFILTMSPPVLAYNQTPIFFKASHTNTGAATLNINGLGAKAIVSPNGAAMLPYDIRAGGIYCVVYDGTSFQLISKVIPPFLYGNSGYQYFDSGLVIQWGHVDTGSSTSGSITFPVTFPNAVFSVMGVDSKTAAGVISVSGASSSTSAVAWYGSNTTNGAAIAPGIWDWIAIGH